MPFLTFCLVFIVIVTTPLLSDQEPRLNCKPKAHLLKQRNLPPQAKNTLRSADCYTRDRSTNALSRAI